MKCPKCGSEVTSTQKFCTKCGQSLASLHQKDSQQSEEKGIIDNITHLGTFVQRGSRGVQAEVRREEQQRLQRQAEAMGMDLVRRQNEQQATDTATQSQYPQQTQERRLVVDSTSVEGVSIVSGRAIWDIKRGEVARRVTESEFANAEGLKGVIVQEGCSALVYIDGQLMSIMQAGVYTFPSKTQAEIVLDQRQRELDVEEKELRDKEEEARKKVQTYSQSFAARGVFGEIAAFGRGVMGFLFGRKKGESSDQHKQRAERVAKKLNAISAPKICRIYIVSNRILQMPLAPVKDAEGNYDFTPIVVPTKAVDLNVGVSLQVKVSNVQLFAVNYLADRDSISIYDIQMEILPTVKALLGQTLRNLDYESTGLPEPVVNNLKNRIVSTCNERLQGIEVVSVLDITDQSADFDRFRQVEKELFCSEKELDFLHRTGEFKNRLEQEQNKQAVDHAANEEQLRQALQAANKDKLLSEDEMEKFVLLLNSQKRIREANAKKDEAVAMEEVREALVDIKKSGLVKDDELEALKNTLMQGQIERENITQIMRIQASQKEALAQQESDFLLSNSKLEHEMAAALRQAQLQGNLVAAQLDTKRLMDAYNDERGEFEWNRDFSHRQKEQELAERQAQMEHDRSRQDKFDDMDILERKAAIAQRNMQAMKDAELAAQREQNRSAESLHSMDVNEQINRDNMFANMTAEQIKAAQLSHLSSEGQAALAQSFGSAQQQAEQKALYEQMLAQQNAQNVQNQEMMMKMAQMMQQGMMGVGAQRVAEQTAMKEEYRENMQQTQQRLDHAQDVALENIGQVSAAAAGNLGAFNGGVNGTHVAKAQEFRCPNCGAPANPAEGFCMECGSSLK